MMDVVCLPRVMSLSLGEFFFCFAQKEFGMKPDTCGHTLQGTTPPFTPVCRKFVEAEKHTSQAILRVSLHILWGDTVTTPRKPDPNRFHGNI